MSVGKHTLTPGPPTLKIYVFLSVTLNYISYHDILKLLDQQFNTNHLRPIMSN